MNRFGSSFVTFQQSYSVQYVHALFDTFPATFTAAMTAIHSNNRATELAGQPIPRNTLLIFNSFSVHMSDQHWRQPKQFRPERFLDENNKVTKPDAFIPFSLGTL